jgi:hypothetical protein
LPSADSGLCDRAFRDKSLAAISEQRSRWDYATSTPGMSPRQALELVHGFAASVQESDLDAQREIVERYSAGLLSEMTKFRTRTYTRYTRMLSGGIYDPERIRTADLLRDREAC